MNDYLNIFIDEDYPHFLDKYLNTLALERIKNVTQFCGCDYTKLYNIRFFYTRFDHSLVVAHMTWHFTKDKTSTIAALFHDAGTPCFAHCIDYVFGDYMNQESSEKDILEFIKEDTELIGYLKEDNITLDDLNDLSKYPIVENKSPRLCVDRLDGVLHSCYIWLQTHELEDIKNVYDNITVLTNEDGLPELGFTDMQCCEKFVKMTEIYAKELQGNTDKYIMKYISEIVKLAVDKNLITIDDLYKRKESEVVEILKTNFKSWQKFEEASQLIRTNTEPNNFYISFKTKKRNVIPLIEIDNKITRIDNISEMAKEIYNKLDKYTDTLYAYAGTIDHLD